jgi:hypothetical protein
MDDGMTRKQKDIIETSTSKRKSSYKKPCLVVYGDLRELTMGIGGTHYDPGHNNTTKKGT